MEVEALSVYLDSSVVRDMNTKKVLSAVRQRTSTRTELARMTHLSYPTVGTIIKELAENGFVADERLGEFGGGRKPMLVRFVPTARYIIGINLGGAEPEAVLSDLNGTFVSPIVKGNIGDLEQDISSSVISLVEDLRRKYPFSWDLIIGIGVCVRGSFDIPNRYYYYPGRAEPLSLQDDLEERFDVPVVLERNASAAALSEWLLRQDADVRNILFVNVDKGVSSGLVVDGQLVRGFLGNAGEFGHVVVDGDGEICPDCGQKGCLENVAALGAIVAKATLLGVDFPEQLNVFDKYRELVTRARRGDEVAICCFESATDALGRSITSLVNVINPQVVVVGGRVIWHYPELLDVIAQSVRSNCWPYSRQGLEFAAEAEDKHNFLHGAIALILDRLFVSNGNEVVADWNSHRDFLGARNRLG